MTELISIDSVSGASDTPNHKACEDHALIVCSLGVSANRGGLPVSAIDAIQDNNGRYRPAGCALTTEESIDPNTSEARVDIICKRVLDCLKRCPLAEIGTQYEPVARELGVRHRLPEDFDKIA